MTSKHKELLVLTAEAMGLQFRMDGDRVVEYDADGHAEWNPIEIDIDCDQMEEKLLIQVTWTWRRWPDVGFANASHNYKSSPESDIIRIGSTESIVRHNGDRDAARRMASTRVAAEIRRKMK